MSREALWFEWRWKTITSGLSQQVSVAEGSRILVPLGNAWVTGASKLPLTERKELTNDPLNLVSADGPANMGKGGDDAAQWLPTLRSGCRSRLATSAST